MLWLGAGTNANAAGEQVVDASQARLPLHDAAQFIALPAGEQLQLEDVLALPNTRWQPAHGDINAGYTTDTYWVRVSLRNDDPQPLARLFEVGYPLLDRIQFFQVNAGVVTQNLSTGDTVPFAQRPLQHRHFVFPVQLPANATTDLYLKVQTSGAMQIPLTLWEERAFHSESERGLIGRAIFYGVLLIMAVFNLFLCLSLRERAHFIYVLVVLVTLVLMTSLHGFNYQYLYPDSPRLHELVILLVVPACQILMCLFTTEFLSLKQRKPAWHRLFRGFIVISALCGLSGLLLPYAISTRLSVFLAIPMATAALTAGVLLWRRGERSAWLFTIAWVALLAGANLAMLNKIGLLPSNFLTEHGIPLGTTVQALLFSLALADRLQRERADFVKTQQASLEAMHQRQQAEHQLLYAASHHEVSGLPNRSLFERALQNHFEEAQNSCEEVVVVLLHLRHFDDVNKTLGHRNADELIRRGARRLNRVVANCPGAVLLEQVQQKSIYAAHVEGVSFAYALAGPSRQALTESVQMVTQELGQPVEFMGLSLDFSFVVGCSFASPESRDPLTLLRQAFVAFDQADVDAQGIAIYEPAMNPYSPRRLTLMTELRTALENNGLALYFQPQIHLPTQRVSGFEALLRWHHPEYGFIPPDEFIPMAEQTGLMKPLTHWVLDQALTFCHRLDEIGCDATVSVNISAVNLRETAFSEIVGALLQSHQLPAQRLALEVTETAAMADPKRALAVLRSLQAGQIRLSIDDFGTGYSSLSYIRKLPVQEIKIDRSFVMEMDSNQGDATIVRTTINMCHDLGYEVVAEGVESEAIVEMLTKLDCDFCQGYHIARPMPADQALAWLAQCRWSLKRDDAEPGDTRAASLPG